MKLAISNIAWDQEEESVIVPALKDFGALGIEVAPTKLWPDWVGASLTAAAAYRQQIADMGLSIPALQAILFAKPEAHLFRSPQSRRLLKDHLIFIAGLMNALGAPVAVFGAPSQRRRDNLPLSDAFNIARDFFADLAPIFAAHDVSLCIEPNPTDYGCDFVTNLPQALSLIKAVDHPGFGLHLDAAGMFLAKDELATTSDNNWSEYIRHFHASEPFLGNFSAPSVTHELFNRSLNAQNYSRWISIEMKRSPSPLPAIVQALNFVKKAYADVLKPVEGTVA